MLLLLVHIAIELVHLAYELVVIFDSLLLLTQFVKFLLIDLHAVFLAWNNNQHVLSVLDRSSLTLNWLCVPVHLGSVYRPVCTLEYKVLHLKLPSIHLRLALLMV